MKKCRTNLPNRCYHLISRVAHRAFEQREHEIKFGASGSAAAETLALAKDTNARDKAVERKSATVIQKRPTLFINLGQR